MIRILLFLMLMSTNAFAFGTAGCSSITSFLDHFDGADASTSMPEEDCPGNGKVTVSASGNAQLSTSVSKFGTASLLLDGTDDYASTATNTMFNFPGDFTMECWAYTNDATSDGGNRRMLSNGDGGTSGIEMTIDTSGRISIIYDAGINITGTTDLRGNVFRHVALTRSGTTIRAFVNGTQEGGSGTSATDFSAGAALFIGTYPAATTEGNWNGRIDEVRITSGVALYTSNFTPPSTPFCSGCEMNGWFQ